ncbi:MAG: DUF4192 domain-containing protein [Geodermatophilaceae bacterium]|nr:DUF4192 domain-containing protein [Geodermatophilaceae bacterium]
MPARRAQTIPPAAPRVRLRTPAQIVASLPYLLGFHPRESLVLIGLGGTPCTVRLTVRVDLPPAEGRQPVAEHLAAHLAHAGAGEVLAVVVTDTEPSAAGEQEVVAAIRAAVGSRRIQLTDALCLRAGRWRSLVCRDASCCPPEGTAVDPSAASELAAVSVVLGEVVHASREDLETTLRPVAGADRAELDRTFEWVSRQLVTELAERGWEAVAEDSVTLLAEAVADRVEGCDALTPAVVARLSLGLGDVRVRDRVLTWADGELASAAESLWVELARRATPPYGAAPATLLAAHAYLRGNGAYARVALDRALASDPAYSLAALLSEGLDRGVPPRALREALVEPQAA